MPKTRETEYRDRTGVEEETEDRDEQVEEKTEFASDDRDSSFRAANQHIVKLTDELHTELCFWQSAMSYTDNATVNVTVLGEQRPRPQEHRLPWWRRPLARDGV